MIASRRTLPLIRSGAHLAATIAYLLGIVAGLGILEQFGFAAIWRANLYGNDFSAIWAGPHALSLGIDPYDPTRWQATVDSFGVQPSGTAVYTYAGWMPIILLPLGLLPLPTAAVLFLVVTMIFCAVSIWLLLREYVPDQVIPYFVFGFVLFGSEPGIVGFYSGQWSFFLLGSVALVAVFFHRSWGGWAGLAAGAFLVKPHLFAIAAPALARAALARRVPRFIWVALAIAVAAAAVSTIVYAHWWVDYLRVLSYQTGNPKSTILPTALGDAFGVIGVLAAVAIMFVAIAFALRFDPRTSAYVAVWLAISPAASLYEFAYDQLQPLVPLVIATGLVARERPLRAQLLATVGVLVVMVGGGLLHGAAGPERGTLSYNAFPQAILVALVMAFLWPYRRADPVTPAR